LTLLYLNYMTAARLERNPTVKDEIRLRGFERDLPAGFLCYPAAQAADITAFKPLMLSGMEMFRAAMGKTAPRQLSQPPA
jgi:tryptophanyl-tRNA synthetase